MKKTLLFLALSCVFPAHAGTAQPTGGSQALTWGACAPGKGTTLTPELLARFDCGWLNVPYDHQASASPTVRMPVLRVRAARPAIREGTIFYHPGGPGADPMSSLMKLAQRWGSIDVTDPDLGDLKLLSDRYDIVALMPRGLTDETRPDCIPFTGRKASQAMMNPDDDAAWNDFVAETRTFAESCGPKAAQINTSAQVADMEALRTALDIPVMHLYGASYGTWVATWYASLHPSHTGRVLLDASLDFERRWLFQKAGLHIYRDRAMIADALKPAVERPDIYGLGTSVSAIRQRLIGMPLFMRRMWAPAVSFSEHVVAALAVADEWTAMPEQQRSFDTLRSRLQTHVFHSHADIDRDMRTSAFALAGALFFNDGSPRTLPYGGPAATFAVYCNDSVWRSSTDDIRKGVRFMDTQATLPRGQDAVMGLICAAWPHAPSLRPSFEALKRLPSIVMMHSSSDWTTPIGAAEAMTRELPNSHFLVSVGLQGHTTLGQPTAKCATRHAAHYLLTGETPSKRRVDCTEGTTTDTPPHYPHGGEL